MKLTLISLGIICFLFSCTPIKVAQVKSEQAQLTDKGFVFENDSIKITYRFWANNGRMEFDVFNKLSFPIYIDWKISSFIPNDKMVSYWRDETNTEAISSQYSYFRDLKMTKSKIKAVRMERIGVIPPESMITQKSFFLVQNFDDLPSNGQFDKKNSPLRFRNYISICNNEKFEGNVTNINNNFFVSGLKSTSSSNYNSNKVITNFYLSKSGPIENEN